MVHFITRASPWKLVVTLLVHDNLSDNQQRDILLLKEWPVGLFFGQRNLWFMYSKLLWEVAQASFS
jgi:hypothetical protein